MTGQSGRPGQSADVEAMSRAMALLYYCVADEFVRRYGQEAREVLRAAIARFGEMRGEEIRRRADRAGLEPDVRALGQCYDLPLSKAWDMESTLKPGLKVSRVSRCPLACVWKELGAEDLGRLYCEVDPALVRGFNPSITFRHERNTLNGDDECVLVYEEAPNETGTGASFDKAGRWRP